LIEFVVAGMSIDFLARAKVSFVKTAVLSSNDGGNTFNEEVVLTNKTDERGKIITAEEMKRIEKQNKRQSSGASLSLYEQLEKNKMEKDELWKAKHGPQAPKGLDEEDILFLNEHSLKQAQKRRKIIEAEDNELESFRIAQRQKNAAINASNTKQFISNKNVNNPAINVDNNDNVRNNHKRKSKLPSNLLRKRHKVLEKEADINNNNPDKNASKIVAATVQNTISALDFLNDLDDDSSSDED
jgi:hypothetical protein